MATLEMTGMIFLKTLSGLFKILEILFALVGYICAEIFDSQWQWVELAFFKTTLIMSLVFALAIMIFHLIHCSRTFSQIPWNKLDSVLCILLAVLLFVSSTMLDYYQFDGISLKDYQKPASLKVALVFSFKTAAVFIINSIYQIVFNLH